MESLIGAITETVSGIFTATIEAFAKVGNLLFTFAEGGTISGISPFGYFLALIIGIPLGAKLFSVLVGFIKRLIPKFGN